MSLTIPLFYFDWRLASGLTTNRLGIVVFAISFAFLARYVRYFSFDVSKTYLVSITFLMLLFVTLVELLTVNVNIARILALAGCLIVYVLLGSILNYDRARDYILRYFGYIACTIVIFSCVLSIINYGFIPEGRVMRSGINSLDPGLNRVLNGLVMLYIASFGNLLISRGWRYRFVFIGASFSIAYLILFTFSRQGMLTLFPAFLSLLLVFGGKKNALSVLIPIFCFCVLAFVIFENWTLINAGFIDRTISQIEDGGSASTRIEIYKMGLEQILDRPLGVGYGEFQDTLGKATHSSYIGLSADYGVVMVLLLCALVVGVLISLKRLTRHCPFKAKIAAMFLAGSVVIAPAFNDILHSPMFGITLLVIYAAFGELSKRIYDIN